MHIAKEVKDVPMEARPELSFFEKKEEKDEAAVGWD